MNKAPWLLTVFFAILAAVSWLKPIKDNRSSTLNTRISPTDKPVNQSLESSINILNTPVATPNYSTEEEAKINEILKDPVIQKYIEQEVEQKVRETAVRIAQENIADYKDQEKRKKIEQAENRMDGMESFFMNSVNTFAEEFDVEPVVVDELATLVENGFQKQRDLFTQLSEGEITEEEYKAMSGESKQEDRAAIRDLLGDNGATDFGTILKEEGRKAKE